MKGEGEPLSDICATRERGPDMSDMIVHRSALRCYLRRRLGPSDDLEDLVQDVYLRVLAAPPRSAISNWRGFLFRIASNLLIDRHRRRSVRMMDEAWIEDGDIADEANADPQRIAEGRQELNRLQTALDELTPVARDIFLLVRVEGLSHKEAAKRLGMTPKAVSHQVERALVRLSSRLGSSA